VTAVLDASALLVVLHGEPGTAVVEPLLDGAQVSAVNWSEVVQKAAARGVDVGGLRDDVEALGVRVAIFDADAAEATAELWAATRDSGRSLGDRACLALARALGMTAVTADAAWADVDVGVTVQLVR
jgi:PIN domain nuclease of toxin-antitoxin system